MQERKSAAEYREMVGLDKPTPARSKHNAQRTEYGGRTYASMKEANRAFELSMIKRAGEIVSFVPQVSMPLSPDSASRYITDFMVVHEDLGNGQYVVSFEDPTGQTTAKKKLNIQMMKDNYGIEVKTL